MAESAQNGASETPTFQAFKASKSATSSTQTLTEEQPRSVSEPEGQKTQETAGEDKGQRKRSNDERRERRWYQERGEFRERIRQLEEKLEQTSQPKTETKFRPEGEPTLQAFLESGKFKTYEDALAGFLEARDDWRDSKRQEAASADTQQKDVETVTTTFQEAEQEYSEKHPEYADHFDALKEFVDETGLENSAFTNAIVRSGKGPELIDYLGSHLEEAERIAAMNPNMHERAIKKLVESLGKSPEKEEQRETVTARTPRTVRGANQAPVSVIEAMSQVKDAKQFREQKRLARKAGKHF